MRATNSFTHEFSSSIFLSRRSEQTFTTPQTPPSAAGALHPSGVYVEVKDDPGIFRGLNTGKCDVGLDLSVFL